MVFAIPSYLEFLPEADPSFPALNATLRLKRPGEGGFREGAPVRFLEQRSVYRIYDAIVARQCGRWWNLDAPQNTTMSYYQEFAVCPEWNKATWMVKCNVPVDFIALVGTGQSADCSDNSTIVPPLTTLQLNANVCSITDEVGRGLTCEWCAADQFSLQTSACVPTPAPTASGSSSSLAATVFLTMIASVFVSGALTRF
uniref:Uncharacterized protein n=1 Tax=Cyclophora tenuis TaxID=216820 RepID=A0A7S1D8F3_CYCTE|mmetsp:Transcript_25697/g.43668  ORF Transcript_25697/g.43668 Transcript_25697/m.43668 type:complete len:199 (+) Transcript_25697:65-661(+)